MHDEREANAPQPPLRAEERYQRPAVVYHWVMFWLVIVVGTLGLLHDSWPKATQSFWINVHALCGLLLWFVLFARIAWRLRHPPPPWPSAIGTLTRRLSGPVHFALYALLLVIPVLGMVTFVWHGRVFDLGLFQIDLGIKKNPAVFRPTEEIHGYLAYALFALAGVHALAALWHRFVLKDQVLQRMQPARGGRGSSH